MDVTPNILAFFAGPVQNLIHKYNRLTKLSGVLRYTDLISAGQYNAPWKIQDFICDQLEETYPFTNNAPLDDIRFYFEIWMRDTWDQIGPQEQEYAADCMKMIHTILGTFYEKALPYHTSAVTYQDQTGAFEAEATLWTIVLVLVSYLLRCRPPDQDESLFDCADNIYKFVIHRSEYVELPPEIGIPPRSKQCWSGAVSWSAPKRRNKTEVSLQRAVGTSAQKISARQKASPCAWTSALPAHCVPCVGANKKKA